MSQTVATGTASLGIAHLPTCCPSELHRIVRGDDDGVFQTRRPRSYGLGAVVEGLAGGSGAGAAVSFLDAKRWRCRLPVNSHPMPATSRIAITATFTRNPATAPL